MADAPWCEACKSFQPLLAAAIAELRKGRPDVRAVRVDGDAQSGLRKRFAVLEAPGLLLLPGGQPVDAQNAIRYDGALDKPAVVEWARRELRSLPKLHSGALRQSAHGPSKAAPVPAPQSAPPSKAPASSTPAASASPSSTTPPKVAHSRSALRAASPAEMAPDASADLVASRADALLGALVAQMDKDGARAPPPRNTATRHREGLPERGSSLTEIDAQLVVLLQRRAAALQARHAAVPASTPPAQPAARSRSPTGPTLTSASVGASGGVSVTPETPPPSASAGGRASAPAPAPASRGAKTKSRASADLETLLFADDDEAAAKQRELDARREARREARGDASVGGARRDDAYAYASVGATPNAQPTATAPTTDRRPQKGARTHPASAGKAIPAGKAMSLDAQLDALLGDDDFSLDSLDDLFADEPPARTPTPPPTQPPTPSLTPSPMPPPPSPPPLSPSPPPPSPPPPSPSPSPSPSPPGSQRTKSTPRAATPEPSHRQPASPSPPPTARTPPGGGVRREPSPHAPPSLDAGLDADLDELLGTDDADEIDLEELLRSPDLFADDASSGEAEDASSGEAEDASSGEAATSARGGRGGAAKPADSKHAREAGKSAKPAKPPKSAKPPKRKPPKPPTPPTSPKPPKPAPTADDDDWYDDVE